MHSDPSQRLWFVLDYGALQIYLLTYWTLRQEDIRSLEAFEMWIWRRMMKIPWTQHASNEQILGMADESRSLMESEKKLEKLDWACLKTRLPITEGHRRKVSRKENSWKTKKNVIGCIDARRWRDDWLRKAERKGPWQKNLASMRKNLPLGRKHQQRRDFGLRKTELLWTGNVRIWDRIRG